MDSSQEKRTAASSAAVKEPEGGKLSYEELAALYDDSMRNLAEGEIVNGRVIHVTGSDVIVDIGFKSEGLIAIEEFRDRDGKIAVNIGDEVEVLLEQTEDADGHILLSKQKAERMRIWNTVEEAYREGKVITGNRAAYDLLRLPQGSNVSLNAPENERPAHFAVYRNGRALAPHELPVQMAASRGVDVRDFEEDIVFDDGTTARHEARLHTVVLEPDLPAVSLVWHTHLECHSRVTMLTQTRIWERQRVRAAYA